MKKLASAQEFRKFSEGLRKKTFKPDALRVRACCGTACTATGAKQAVAGIREKAKDKGLDLEIVETGCQGLCQKGPVMNTEPSGIFYQKVRSGDAADIVNYTFVRNTAFRQSLFRNDILSEPITEMNEIPFYKKQVRIALRNNGSVDPRRIDQYIALGGYAALVKALGGMSPDEVLDEVDRANVRGRGGAGFPAGRKWKHTKSSGADIKFVIANGDEGDPGAFMDRAIMEGDPHSLLEGMLLCAYAIEARYGMIYVRHEYPLAVENLSIAIRQAEELGLLGTNILGSGFSFTMDIREGAGAFVCGESTALVASIEGERGFPRVRPPRLSESGGGAWCYPSNLNNIETYALIPPIVEKGSEWFRSIGTENSPGTKVFALTGKVNNTGLVEVPMGITLREIIYDIGGGIMDEKKFKAVQTGGPSGGCIPEQYLDMSVDFDSLWEVGSMMGSGGMVVMDETTCMVDVAKFFLAFTQAESCGKCPPCRLGTHHMLEIMERITSGTGTMDDLERLEEIAKHVEKTSLCGLGQGAPIPVLSTLRYFRDEYEEHVTEKYCSAKVCRGLGTFVIEQKDCILCGLCVKACVYDAVKETRDTYFIDQTYCTKCKACYTACPTDAVQIIKKLEPEDDPALSEEVEAG
jgi:NADH:ubiquinone oxidoreductase subunit F (NADH-binding)/(2Fe-2S) ferredoxin